MTSQPTPVRSNVVSMPTDKKARDALRKVRAAIERVAPGLLPKAESDIDTETNGFGRNDRATAAESQQARASNTENAPNRCRRLPSHRV